MAGRRSSGNGWEAKMTRTQTSGPDDEQVDYSDTDNTIVVPVPEEDVMDTLRSPQTRRQAALSRLETEDR